jgi:CO/xanthine dehydrogenase FAD-binding subunit
VDVLVPRSLDEALEFKSARPDAVPVAGGTDLMVGLNFGRLRPSALLDLSRLEELKTWWRDDGTVSVGAGMTFTRIAEELVAFPALVQAALSVGSRQIRNRATIGGNLATASPAGDGIAVLAAYDAEVVVERAGLARRVVPWREFLIGPKRTSLQSDELITAVRWRVPEGSGSFTKVGPRNAMVIAVASACLQREENGGIRLALGSVAPTVVRARRAEAFAEQGADPVEFGRLAADETQPIDDLRGSAAYRRHAVEVLARRALARALEERC